MIEIELFFKKVEAKIRERHTDYLEHEKREAVPVILPVVDELPTGEAWQELGIIARCELKKKRKKQLKSLKKAEKKQREVRVADRLLKGYNAGVRMALTVLISECSKYRKWLKKQEKGGNS